MSINPKHAFSEGTSMVPFLITIRGSEARKKLADLNSDEERTALLDGIVTNLDMKMSGWVDLYEAIKLVSEHPTFWKAKGHDTFDTFLHDTMGSSLQQWHELESIYNYAKVACPDLFEIDQIEAAKLKMQIDEVPVATTHGGRTTTLSDELEHAMNRKTEGQHSLSRVVARLKRDNPEVIAAAMAEMADGTLGNFVRKDKHDRLFWDVATLERAGGMESQVEQKARLKIAKTDPGTVSKAIRNSLLKIEDEACRAAVIKAIRSVEWTGL